MALRACGNCGTSLAGTHGCRKFCSDRCRYRNRPPGRRTTQPCALCGEPMPVFPGRTLPVGAAAHQACRRQRPGYRNTRAEPGTQRWTCGRCGKDCERIATRGRFPKLCEQCRPNSGAHIPDRLRAEVYERDGWVCGICTEPVDAELIGSLSDWRPSIDHIVPRSAGGDEQPTNLRLAHFWCNATRGAALYGDEVFRAA